jgi:hypothetical protein
MIKVELWLVDYFTEPIMTISLLGQDMYPSLLKNLTLGLFGIALGQQRATSLPQPPVTSWCADLLKVPRRQFTFCAKVKVWKQIDGKWVSTATIKTPSPATAIDFSPVNSIQQYVSHFGIFQKLEFILMPRRKLAVGLEDGTIQIFSNMLHDLTSWRLDTTIDKGCVLPSRYTLQVPYTMGYSASPTSVKSTG